MFDWLLNIIDNALNSESLTSGCGFSDSSSLHSDHLCDLDSFERFDNFGCGAPLQVSAEVSYLAETRSHDFTTTTFGDSLSTDWSSSSFGSSSFSSWD